ncbi:MAG: HEAT repeat domain-containing protein [Myxococcota bacterium]
MILPVALVLLAGPGWTGEARGEDRVDRLVHALTQSDNYKQRISAALSLGKVDGEARAVDALIAGLDDEHDTVRAVAAKALGQLGDTRALPALRRMENDDSARVRRRAARAVTKLEVRARRQARAQARQYQVSRGVGQPGFGQSPRAVARPQLYLTVKTTTDRSSEDSSRWVRQRRAREMKKQLRSAFESAPEITTNRRLARKLGVERYQIDAAITRLAHRARGATVEVQCQIRVAISDERGKMLSFLNGAAAVSVPSGEFDEADLSELRQAAMHNAVQRVQRDLVQHLSRAPNPS